MDNDVDKLVREAVEVVQAREKEKKREREGRDAATPTTAVFGEAEVVEETVELGDGPFVSSDQGPAFTGAANEEQPTGQHVAG